MVLQPRPAPLEPELISDGGGLPFAPAALAGPPAQLDREDPAVGALIAQIAQQTAAASLDGWRMIARSDDEILFARGRPPRLLTVAVRRDARRGKWTCVGVSAARPLRAVRARIRASGWRLDPTHEVKPEETVLRVLVSEQAFAGGQRADRRLLPPDLHVGAQELVLTMFVTPLAGFQTRTSNPETPARIALPEQVGQRRLVDGAQYERGVPTSRP